MSRAQMVFTVRQRGLAVRVRVLTSVDAVHREWMIGGYPRQAGRTVHAFFQPDLSPLAKTVGTLVLPVDGPLAELVPHEVVHAVMHRLGGVHCTDDERLATTVGLLTARILRQIARRGIEVAP